MATFTTRTVTSTRHEWIVPAAEPWGAPAEEVSKAWAVAAARYREAHGLPEDAAIPGNALTFHVTDDAIVISYTIEEAA
ncbi:hypothetical protein [Streptomyces himalayensis]|uniref:Uncharacterized protein n=1 Tax=Streptomyces himalayensis subsp. himalayensis TaxID=2756131 RepID=A0A7W0DUN3_9ACTN|nr:hypothetical protein [Streptomyces himalayensis]MBA2951623.1 hypothetical protein [Streptomyces himalayensis subsp. himalayensis]